MNTSRALIFAIIAGTVLLMRCSSAPVAGGTIETTNGAVARVLYPSGEPVAHAIVRVRKSDFLSDTSLALAKNAQSKDDALTDDSGYLAIDSLDTGDYCIEAVDANGNSCVMTIAVGGDTLVDLGTRVVQPGGRIAGSLPTASQTYIRIRGLERCVKVNGARDFSLTVPAGRTYTINAVTNGAAFDTTLGEPVIASQTSMLAIDLSNYATDSLLVRAFLDRMGLQAVPVESVCIGDSAPGRIRNLSLSGRGVTSIPSSIGALNSVWTLDLSGCPITDLPASLSRMSSLRNLTLNRTTLSHLPDAVVQCSALVYLDMRSTGITTLPQSMANLSALAYLGMTEDSLDSVPQVIFSMRGLRTLILSNNRLRVLPGAIGNLTNLESLHIDGNQLDSLPTEIGQLSAVKSLYVYSNKLTSLPSSLGNLTLLEQLSASFNLLDSLPATIGSLRGLTTLSCSYNRLVMLPSTITSLHPQTVELNDNRLCSLSPDLTAWMNTYAESIWLSAQTCH